MAIGRPYGTPLVRAKVAHRPAGARPDRDSSMTIARANVCVEIVDTGGLGQGA
jgi:hypothetical protein